MEIVQSIVLGLIQGITEFLPVSSTAHLFLIPWLFSWQDQGLPFTVALHVGSLFAILYCFREELVLIIRDFFCGLRSFSFEGRQDGRTGVYLIVATLPAVATGFLFERYASGVLRDPVPVAAFLLGFGALLYISDRKTTASKTLRDMNLVDALFFGVAQAFAILPGASRAGVTITGGLFRNYRREEAARFSFLLAIPVIVAAGVFEVRHLGYAEMFRWSFALGVATSFLSALFAIRFLLGYVRTRSFTLFVVYRAVLSVVIIAVYLWA
ncbi:MAG: undecaprenyl-diphosphate phosphatase [Candidatus Dadabacteria bacterium]|nr:undecaprenyl-diphosphate phosphatase [Candidatus Dadabacteria bacterium]MYC40679.1 undecaprenyl-diphosphate phosphatase [Candidatus Dadabacteria bacterium]